MTKEEVKNIRKELGFTQQMMAERVGVDIKTIRNYEKIGNIPKTKEAIFLNLKKASSYKEPGIVSVEFDSKSVADSNLRSLIGILKTTLVEKDKQIDRLLSIIEQMNKKK